MAIFEDIDLRFRVREIEVEQHDDRWGGDEPYVIPVFFKVDGERYTMTVRIFNTQPPDEGTSEVVETSALQLELESDPEEEPLVFLPPGPLILGESATAGQRVSLPDIVFETTLQPIPLAIDILGLFGFGAIADRIADQPIVTELIEGEMVDLLNLTLNGISDVLGKALGLDETLESCPPLDVDADDFVRHIEAEMRGLIKGSVGGVFVALENDDFDEDDAQTVQGTIRDEIVRILNEITDGVTRVNPIPDVDPESVVDRDALELQIICDLVFRWDPGFWLMGTAGWLWGGPDDTIGVHVQMFDHESIEPGTTGFSARLNNGSDRNEWILRGNLRVP